MAQISTSWALGALIYPQICWAVIYTPAAAGQIIPDWLCGRTNTSVLTSLKSMLWAIILERVKPRPYFSG